MKKIELKLKNEYKKAQYVEIMYLFSWLSVILHYLDFLPSGALSATLYNLYNVVSLFDIICDHKADNLHLFICTNQNWVSLSH